MVSPIGYILIPASIVLFVRGRRTLLWGTLVFVPFTNLEVVNIGVTTIRGYQLFGSLFIARCFFDLALNGEKGIKKSWANIMGAIFIFICFVSLSMAVLKAGTVEVYTNVEGMWREIVRNSIPLRLSSFNFTQVLFPAFGVLLFCFIVREIRSETDLKKAINILVWGTLVVAGMAIASGALYTIGQGSIYASLINLSTVGPPSNFGAPKTASIGQFLRSYTIAGEPGFTAMTLLMGLGLVAGNTLTSHGSSVVRAPTLKLFILASALLLNGSTTGYFGAALLVAWGIVLSWYVRRVSLGNVVRTSGYVLGCVAVLGLIASAIEVSGMSFYEWLTKYHLAKILGDEVGSGYIRSYVTWYTLTEVFPTSPILGVGYGSHRSLSLVSFLLANVGLVGFGIFLTFLYITFRNAKNTVWRAKGSLRTMAFAAALTFVPFLATLFVAKATSGINYGLTWTVIALAEATYQVYLRQRRTAQQVAPTA